MQSQEYAETLARIKKDIFDQRRYIENAARVLDVSEALYEIDRLNKRIHKDVVMLDMYASTNSYQLNADAIDLDALK